MGKLQKHLVKALAVLGVMLGGTAQAQSFAEYPEARIDTYPVTGATPAEIFSSISRNAPGMIHAGQPAHAVAFSQFHWRTRSTGRDWCDVELKLDLWVTFPAHVDPHGLTGKAGTGGTIIRSRSKCMRRGICKLQPTPIPCFSKLWKRARAKPLRHVRRRCWMICLAGKRSMTRSPITEPLPRARLADRRPPPRFLVIGDCHAAISDYIPPHI